MTLDAVARLALAAGLLVSAAGNSPGTTILDPFRDGQSVGISAGTPTITTRSDSTLANAPGSLGGQREITLRRSSGGSAEVDVGITQSGALIFASGPLTQASALLVWDGAGTSVGPGMAPDEFGLHGIDLTEGGKNDRMIFRATSDLGVTLLFTIYDASGQTASAEFLVPAGFVWHDYQIAFGDFSGPERLSIVLHIRMCGHCQLTGLLKFPYRRPHIVCTCS